MSKHGNFSGNPKTEWLTTQTDQDRDMRLIEDFSFTDPDGRTWLAPTGSVINGASIPRSLWALVGSPYTDDYRRASVVHDVACNTPSVERKDADVMFYHACRAGGCSAKQAQILYAGVRIGAWASVSLPSVSLSRERILFRHRLDHPVREEEFLKGKLADISSDMETLSDDASIDSLDEVIERHLNMR